MPLVTLLTNTWACPVCGYTQDADPYDEAVQHSPDWYPDVPLGYCPHGWITPAEVAGHHEQKMGMDINAASSNTVTAPSDAELEAILEPAFDETGQPIMEPTGEMRYQFNPLTGQIDPVEVMAQKMVPITQERFNELQLQRNQNLDALSAVTVSEVSA